MSKTLETQAPNTPFRATHQGGCHCGAVRFEVALPTGFNGSRCNCSICAKTAVTGAIVKPEAFRLLTGQDALSGYQWGAKISTRHFCRHCGVQCFGAGHLEQIGGDFVSVNLNALDQLDVSLLDIVYWDGRHDNWMEGHRAAPWPLLRQAG
jgi:hypothetical protein